MTHSGSPLLHRERLLSMIPKPASSNAQPLQTLGKSHRNYSYHECFQPHVPLGAASSRICIPPHLTRSLDLSCVMKSPPKGQSFHDRPRLAGRCAVHRGRWMEATGGIESSNRGLPELTIRYNAVHHRPSSPRLLLPLIRRQQTSTVHQWMSVGAGIKGSTRVPTRWPVDA